MTNERENADRMQLGSSRRRRRGRGDDEPERFERRTRAGRGRSGGGRSAGRLALAALVVALLGGAGGWLLATRVLFPPPPPPGDLYEVPDLYGMAAEQALDRIRSAGLSAGTIDAFRHPSVDSGRVIGQDPLPGQLARPGDSVRISMSLGVELRAVPAVAQLRADRARLMLETQGFTVLVDSVESPEPRGRVISLDPPPGSQVAVPGEVRLTISVGPPQVEMPTILGMLEAQARDTLNALGFVVAEVEQAFGFDAADGQIVGQDPPPGRLLELGSAVRIVVGRQGERPDTLRAPRRRR